MVTIIGFAYLLFLLIAAQLVQVQLFFELRQWASHLKIKHLTIGAFFRNEFFQPVSIKQFLLSING